MLRKRNLISFVVLVALLFTVACQPITAQSQPAAPPTDEDVVAAVNAIWREYEASVIASDVDRWIAQWTDEGVQMPPNEPLVEGKENIYARVGANMAAGPTTDFVITPLETTSAGDWAYSRGVYTVTFPLGDGEQGFLDGKFMTILQRQPDGTWKIHRDIFNSNVPPTAPAAEDVNVEAVTEAVTAIWNEYEASLSAGDVDRWVDLWTAEGIQLPPGEPPVIGKEAIRARNKAALTDLFDIAMSINNEEVVVGSEWAVARGVYSATLTPKAGGDDVLVDGKYMTLLQRQADGSWKIFRDIFNSNVPPAAAPVTDVDEVTNVINATWREYEASQLAGDPDRWIALWADDGVQLPPGSPAVVGKAAIDARDREDLAVNEYSEFTINNEEVEVSGDLAFARGTFKVTVTAKSGGDPIHFEGKYTTIFRQQPDGTWKIYRDTFNANE